MVKFDEIFSAFLAHKNRLKMLNVATCDLAGKPNAVSKMIVDVIAPNHVYYLDYPFTHTYANLQVNPQISISFMDDTSFTGYRLTGRARILKSGADFKNAKKQWAKRLIRYEADRMIQRITGHASTREAENALPENFFIVKVTATEGAVIKADRALRAVHGLAPQSDTPAAARKTA